MRLLRRVLIVIRVILCRTVLVLHRIASHRSCTGHCTTIRFLCLQGTMQINYKPLPTPRSPQSPRCAPSPSWTDSASRSSPNTRATPWNSAEAKGISWTNTGHRRPHRSSGSDAAREETVSQWVEGDPYTPALHSPSARAS